MLRPIVICGSEHSRVSCLNCCQRPVRHLLLMLLGSTAVQTKDAWRVLSGARLVQGSMHKRHAADVTE